jgi:hypothetical protein
MSQIELIPLRDISSPVGVDRLRCTVTANRLRQKPLGSLLIPFLGEQKVNADCRRLPPPCMIVARGGRSYLKLAVKETLRQSPYLSIGDVPAQPVAETSITTPSGPPYLNSTLPWRDGRPIASA